MARSLLAAALAVALVTLIAAPAASSVQAIKEYYDICDQVTLLGYPCEHQIALTEDGFELDVIHIPANRTVPGQNHPPVILQHGLLDSAITWVANAHPNQNLACLLHDQGFDVWMPNSRGNHYSMGNTKYEQSQSEYWRRIDMDYMAKHDLPAVVELALAMTPGNYTTVGYVGHSQGTWQAFTAFGNLHPNLAKKVNVFAALAPVAYVGHQTSFLVSLLADIDVAAWLGVFGDKTFLENDWLLRKVAYFCKDLGEVCPSVLELICGDGNPANTNASQIDTLLRYDPGGTSVNNMIHWEQEVRSKAYQAHDYGFLENEKIYHQGAAPHYHLSTMVNPPTALFSGSRDALADPKDVQIIVDRLPNTTMLQHTVIDGFAHLDFVWGLDAARLLYVPYVVPLLQKYAEKKN